MQRILLADDDTELCELLSQYLEAEGFFVTAVNDGQQVLETIRRESFDLIILDVMLPRLSGFEVLRELRQYTKIPVLMLTARGADIDRIIGLEMGADDYLPKPCNPRELVARMRAIFRRVPKTDNETLTIGDITLNLGKHITFLNEKEVLLTTTEFILLAILIRNAGTVVTKEMLNENALGRKLTSYDRSLDMHVSNLRKKLGFYADGTVRIKTIRSTGYQYILPP